jgi:hypothetical protein
MWGTSYADLAKRAQELQEQAALAANTLSVRLTFVVPNVPALHTCLLIPAKACPLNDAIGNDSLCSTVILSLPFCVVP